jgi:hypothetical protein
MAPLGLRAQLDPVSLAFRAYQAKDLSKARELIETAVGMQPYDLQAKTWYFKAKTYINKIATLLMPKILETLLSLHISKPLTLML